MKKNNPLKNITTEKVNKLLELPIVKKAKKWIENNPKRSYFIMMGLIILSLTYNIIHYVTYKNNDVEISNVLKHNREEQTKSNLRKDNINKQLEYLRGKEILSKTDTLKIKFLLKSLEDER